MLSNASSSCSTTNVPIDDWRHRRLTRLAKTAHTSPRRLEQAEPLTPPARQPASPLRPNYTCSAASALTSTKS